MINLYNHFRQEVYMSFDDRKILNISIVILSKIKILIVKKHPMTTIFPHDIRDRYGVAR